ncbi:MAG: hypothetical protein B7Y99_00300 [Caulobacterales bacterium 32-69-10]|nr:MAG: hypothetical protein B7Y99_00300 [Caulobacterales bacterium 32-69-10]
MRIGWLALVVAAVLGATAATGVSWAVRHAHAQSTNLHDVIHSRFKLSDAERARLELAEDRYSQRRNDIQLSIRAANWRLAASIKRDPELSSDAIGASKAVEDSAGELQRVTLEHIFEMRAALDPQHRATYDAVLVDALTRDP